jgi:hypothetical protein
MDVPEDVTEVKTDEEGVILNLNDPETLDPGDGRTLPPLNRPDFVAAMREWVHNGAACPK